MIQKMMIEVETDKLLPEYGDRHIILYDNTKKRYYVQTREQFLEVQNKEIKKIEEKIKKHEENMKKYIAQMDKKFSDFLLEYSETNSKLINMVKKVVVEG